MPRRARRAAGLLLLLSAARPASGEQIVLNLTSTAELRGGVLNVVVNVRNLGDAAAASLRPRVALGEQQVVGASRASLAPGQDFDVALSLSLPAPGLRPGRWPFRVAVDYTDSAAHPYQAMQAGLLDLGAAAPPELQVMDVQAPPLAESGALRVRVRNAGAVERRARVALLTSADLEPPAAAGVTLGPGRERELELPLVVRSAQPGSRYAVYVVLEYDDADTHQAQLVEAQLDVRPRQARLAPWLFGASGLLLLLWAGALVRRRFRTPAPA